MRSRGSSSLYAIANCGDGVRGAGEECDDGNTREFDGCSQDCLLERGSCGDGVVERALGEQCEPSIHDASLPFGCDGRCRFILTSCGDGKTDLGEECDDGGNNSNTPGAYCRSDCSFARCGDAIVDAPQGEECDDGNKTAGDGCTKECRVERNAPQTLAAQVFDLPVTQQTSSSTIAPPLSSVTYVNQPPIAATGPGSLAAMAAGAASGVAYMRRKKFLNK